MAKGDRYVGKRDKEDSEMLEQTNKTLAIYRERGKQGKRLERVYRQLFKQELYELAYAETYANSGATTKGSEGSSYDGMSMEVIDKIIGKVRKEQYKWKPVRRVYIPKSDGSKRPLGVSERDDKLLQTAMKILLEAYYEPKFSNRSHGFRPNRSCATALIQMCQKHADTNWFIEGDIKGCFDNIDHETLLGIMANKIEDGRMISLTRKLLKAGVMENWRKTYTYSGTPQGGIISPLLTNIYMDVFDKWVESELLPKYNQSLNPIAGRGRRKNPEYIRLTSAITRAMKKGDTETYRRHRNARENVPSVIPNDEGFRKLEYVRYADDFLLSFSGPKREATEIKEEIRKFLKDRLKLELSKEKTLITHARAGKAKFLGYEISLFQNSGKKVLNGQTRFSVPKEVINKATRKYTKQGKPVHRNVLLEEHDLEIIWTFQSEYKGLVEYYRMAHNLHALSMVGWVAQAALLKTLAHKHKTSVRKISKKYSNIADIDGQKYKVIEASIKREGKKPITARFGAVSLARNPKPTFINDEKQKPFGKSRNEIIDRLKADQCEMCGKTGKVEVHHIRKLRDMHKKGRKRKPLWAQRMIAIRRKTLMCCPECHRAIGNGQHLKAWDSWKETLESRVR
jgi:group II intron reverse transcriptase/maturase